jgi:hypothetical protein
LLSERRLLLRCSQDVCHHGWYWLRYAGEAEHVSSCMPIPCVTAHAHPLSQTGHCFLDGVHCDKLGQSSFLRGLHVLAIRYHVLVLQRHSVERMRDRDLHCIHKAERSRVFVHA